MISSLSCIYLVFIIEKSMDFTQVHNSAGLEKKLPNPTSICYINFGAVQFIHLYISCIDIYIRLLYYARIIGGLIIWQQQALLSEWMKS